MSASLNHFLEQIGFNQSPFTQRSAEVEQHLDRYYVEPPYFQSVLGDPTQPTSRIYFAARGNGKTAAARMTRYVLTNTTRFGAVLVVNFGPKQFNQILNSLNRDFGRLSQLVYHQQLLQQTYLAWKDQAPRLQQFFQVRPLDLSSERFDDLELLSERLHENGVLSIYFLVDGIDELEETTADPERGAILILPLLTNLELLEHSCLAFKFFLPKEIEEPLRASGKARTDRIDAFSEEWGWSQKDLLSLLQRRLEYFSNDAISSLGPYSENPLIDVVLCENAFGSPRNLIRLGNYLLEEHVKESIPDLISIQALDQAIVRLKESVSKEIYTSVGRQILATKVKSSYEPSSSSVAATIEQNTTSFSIPFSASLEEPSKLLLTVEGDDVYIGGQRVNNQPTGRELQLLKLLYEKQGSTCSKNYLIEQLFPNEEASDEQLSSAVKRVRKKLKQVSNLEYIKTIKNVGYRLEHFRGFSNARLELAQPIG